MQIQFLGTGDAFCSGGRFQTCFLVNTPSHGFLLDCGATSLLALKRQGIDSTVIDSIIISHFHGDHYGGIPYLLIDANFIVRRTKPLTIAGPTGVAQRVEELLDKSYPGTKIKDLLFEVNFTELKPDLTIPIGPLKVEVFPVVHVPDSCPHGLRVHYQETILAFSGDTGWTETLFKIADSADLFICECNFFSTELPSHLNYKKLIAEIERFNCKRLILNHFGEEMLQNLHACDIECSEDGLTIETITMPGIPSERKDKESYIAVLLMLAEADNRDHINEERFINHVAIRLGLTEQDVKAIDKHPENLTFDFPKDEQSRMNLLYHLLFLMKIDGSVGTSEIKLCHEIGLRLGFNYQMVDELIGVMTEYIGKTIPQNKLLNIVKKYLN